MTGVHLSKMIGCLYFCREDIRFRLSISPVYQKDKYKTITVLMMKLLVISRYAILCGQCSEHESIHKRIQAGHAFKVGRAAFLLLLLFQLQCGLEY